MIVIRIPISEMAIGVERQIQTGEPTHEPRICIPAKPIILGTISRKIMPLALPWPSLRRSNESQS